MAPGSTSPSLPRTRGATRRARLRFEHRGSYFATGLTLDVGGEALRAASDALGALKARAGGGNEPG
jgi:hypothetical protein